MTTHAHALQPGWSWEKVYNKEIEAPFKPKVSHKHKHTLHTLSLPPLDTHARTHNTNTRRHTHISTHARTQVKGNDDTSNFDEEFLR